MVGEKPQRCGQGVGKVDTDVVSAKGSIRFQNISKRYGELTVVDDVNLDIRPGEFFSLLGPSGSGKTTTLMMLAGFAAPDSGRIMLNGKDRSEEHTSELQSLMRISYAVFCLTKKKSQTHQTHYTTPHK